MQPATAARPGRRGIGAGRSDWFGRAQATVIYIYVNDYHEAIYFIRGTDANGRTNVGTVSLDANELKFGADGSLTLHLSHQPPADGDAGANWLPAPDDQFALIVRTYVPSEALLTGDYQLPNVDRA